MTAVYMILAALVALIPLPALAADAEVATQEDLLAALEGGETSLVFTDDISTDTNILIEKETVIDLDGYTWTVDGGTVAYEQNTVIGGKLTASKKGTVRLKTAIALEYGVAGDRIQSVTYTDGETDSAAFYIAEQALDGNRTAHPYLKLGKTVSRVTTTSAFYRLGTADTSRLSLVYPITYDLDGGKLENAANPTEYTAADAPITLVNPVREGFTFLGWTGTGLTEPTETVTVPMGSTGSRSYIALWEESETPPQGGFPSGGGSRPSVSINRPSANTASTEAETESAPTIDEDGWYDDKDNVALYIHTYGKLPPNYVSKNDAEDLYGWTGGALDKYEKGMAIGGSKFGNYEGILPKKSGRQYYECDIGTVGTSSRGAKRIVYSNDGLIYYTDDHYESFELLYGEE